MHDHKQLIHKQIHGLKFYIHGLKFYKCSHYDTWQNILTYEMSYTFTGTQRLEKTIPGT